MGRDREREERLIFTVTDLKQYAYCPRIVFYTYCLPLIRPVTGKMEEGRSAHREARDRERRRTLRIYGLERATRHFDVWVVSEELGLSGRIDLVLEVTPESSGVFREWIPVDYKQTGRRAGPHLRRQLAAYGMMLEETWGGVARRGLIYSLLTRRVEEIPLTPALRWEVRETVAAMREMVERERIPDPPPSRRPCAVCEFRRFCNDVG
jgi:CRISPR-associated exonuclease Cas4